MPSSTAQRERLVTPLNLAVMLGLFAVAFWVLKPDTVPGVASNVSTDATASPDQLDVAYLKAQQAAGNNIDEQVLALFARLLRANKLDEAQLLLNDHPTLPVDEALRLEFDLELAAQESPLSLQPVLRQLIDTPGLQSRDLLQRATELARHAGQADTSLTLFRLLAQAIEPDSAQMSAAYRDCGQQMLNNGKPGYAITCYREGLNAAQYTDDIFDFQAALLPLLEAADPARESLIDELMSAKLLSAEQLTELASVLLRIERPDQAFRLYGRLALRDPDAGEAWLPEAARWAEAANKPSDAAVFLEALAKFKQGDEKRRLDVRIESLLIATGQSRAAYKRLKSRINNNDHNAADLNEGIVLARQLDDYEQALDWNSLLLDQSPEDLGVISLQRELALAVGDLAQAKQLSEKLVRLSPRDVSAKRRLAQISEWEGDPEAALRHWLSVSGVRSQLPFNEHLHALREVVRLAELTLQPGVAVKALRELTLIDTPSADDAIHLLALYELDGRPDEGSVALQDIIALHGPQPQVLRALAAHEYYHGRYEESLDAWGEYAAFAGVSGESTLAKMEMLWRLDRKDKAAEEAHHLRGRAYLSQASDYQLRLMAEIAWRYRLPWLALGVQPRLDSLEVEDQRVLHAQRSLEVLKQTGKDQLAMQESIKLWDTTGDADFALAAMQLAVKVDSRPVIQRFSPQAKDAQKLRLKPSYWAQMAAIHLRSGDAAAANDAYARALRLDGAHTESIAGLIWMAIGEHDEVQLQQALNTYKSIAMTSPDLWQAMAVGYLQLGAASSSLLWFDKLLDQVDTDYGMLLTYADALEYAGRSAAARDVRQYTLQQLRPLLVEGTRNEQSLLLRQYARLSSRYGTVESNGRLIEHLLAGTSNSTQSKVSLNPTRHAVSFQDFNAQNNQPQNKVRLSAEDLWREDMAITWLMATQQHEHARVAMGQIHSERLKAPAWQQLALALKDNDQDALQSLVVAKGPLSIGNHILALRQLGQEREAYVMARQALVPGMQYQGFGIYDRQVAAEQLLSLRSLQPSYVAGVVNSRYVDGLSVTESGVSVRHSMLHRDLGFSVDLRQRQLSSDKYSVDGVDELSDIAMSVYFGNSRRGGQIMTGLQSSENDDLVYAGGRYVLRHPNNHQQAFTEFAYNESIGYSPELLIAGTQDRLTLGYELDFARRHFLNIRADATEINTRVERVKVAQGFGGSVELGIRGAFGSNAWSSSVQAGSQSRDRVDELPEELRLSSASEFAGILAEDEQTLSFGGSLSRGGVASNFPQVSTPRYYVNARVAQSWPQRVVGLQVGAGAGIRVLGGDELSFSVAHDTQPSTRNSNDTTSVGMHYRYHFQ